MSNRSTWEPQQRAGYRRPFRIGLEKAPLTHFTRRNYHLTFPKIQSFLLAQVGLWFEATNHTDVTLVSSFVCSRSRGMMTCSDIGEMLPGQAREFYRSSNQIPFPSF
jgi:hypothetical protein